jgi:hypothetical protein
MKAQLIFEFMIAVVIFFGIVLYVMNYLNGTMAGYSGEFFSESMKSKSGQIGEMLVMNQGNWTPSGGLVVAGLADGWPVLNRTKINWMNAYCNNNYQAFTDNLEISPRNRLKIVVNETRPDGTVSSLADCPSGQTAGLGKTETRRYVLVPDASSPGVMNVAVVYVYVW